MIFFYNFYLSLWQCCGSMTIWGGSGSADPCLRLMDPDPAILVIDLQDANLFFYTIFSAYYFWSYIYVHHLSKIKSQKEIQNSRNQGFSYYFCMMIEGPDPDPYLRLVDPDPGRPKTCGSGSGSATLVCGKLSIYAPMSYTAPCVRFLMRADRLRGEGGVGPQNSRWPPLPHLIYLPTSKSLRAG